MTYFNSVAYIIEGLTLASGLFKGASSLYHVYIILYYTMATSGLSNDNCPLPRASPT